MQRKLVRIFLSLFMSALCSYAVQAYVIHEDYKLVEDKMEAWHKGTSVNLTSGRSVKFSIAIPTGQVLDGWRFYKNIGLGVYQSYETLGSDNPISIAYDEKYEQPGETWYLVPCIKQMTYVLSYNKNSGEWTDDTNAISTNKYSATVTAPSDADIARSNYELIGWGTKKTGSVLVEPGEEFDGSDLGISANGQRVTLYAIWKAEQYPLTLSVGEGVEKIGYKINGASDWSYTTVTKKVQVDYDSTWIAKAVAKEGWSPKEQTASGTMTADGAEFAPTVTLNQYDLTLEVSDGVESISCSYAVKGVQQVRNVTSTTAVKTDYGAAWEVAATIEDGWQSNGTCSSNGVMGVTGAVFRPRPTRKQYALELEVKDGIARIGYKVNGASDWSYTTVSTNVMVNYDTTWYVYAEAMEGFKHTATSKESPASAKMGTDGATFSPEVLRPRPLTMTKGKGIAAIYFKTNGVADWIETALAEETVYVMEDDWWYAYAVADTNGYTYTATSAERPIGGQMTSTGAEFKPVAEPNYITVRFMGNGSTGNDGRTMADQEFRYGVPQQLTLNTFIRKYHIYFWSDGGKIDEKDAVYEFGGWNSQADGYGSYSYKNGDAVTNPCGSTGAPTGEPEVIVHLYAKWSGGSTTLPQPTKEGYDFSGWYTAQTGGQRVGGASMSFAPPQDGIKLFAHWRPHVTKLTFIVDSQEKAEFAHTVANGGKYGEFGSLPELTSDDPTKKFLGWYTEPEGGIKITDATEVNLTGDAVKLYAQWENVEYKIVYMENGGTIVSGKIEEYIPGQEFMLPTNVKYGEDESRQFLGWYGYSTFEGDRVYSITSSDRGDKTFYAKWSVAQDETVTLTFVNVTGYEYFTNTVTHAWGWKTIADGTTPTLTKTYAKGASVTLPEALFAKEGHTQVGWRRLGDSHANPDTAWEAAEVGDSLGNVTQDRTYHTIWQANTYTIVYNGNGGTYNVDGEYKGNTEIRHEAVMYGAREEIPAQKSWIRTGYTCVGWSPLATGHAVYTNGETVVNLTTVNNGVVTLYAVWEKNTVATANTAKSSPKPAALLSSSPSYSPAPLTLSSSPILAAAQSSQLTYTIHFSPGAAVVDPQAMTNWTVSGSVELPDCLYTNVQGSTFAGWTYQGEPVENPFNPDVAFDGQIVTVTAAWEPVECGDLSNAVGLTNAVLTCDDGTWSVCKEAKEVHSGTTCLKVTELDRESTSILQMCANGSGQLTYQWKTDDIDCPVSIIVDGVSYAVVATEESVWEEKSLPIAGASVHTIVWYVPKHTGFPNFWLDDIRWEPEQPTYELTAKADPDAGGTVSVNGTSFESGSTAKLKAAANPGYTFVQWNDGSTNLTHTVTVWGDITNYVARFEKVATYRISVTAVPAEGGTVTGQGDYPIGTTTNLTATASDGWIFLHWADGSMDTNREIRVISDATYTALFTNVCEVTASANPVTGGTVTGGGRYVAGTKASMTAEAETGWSFDYWSDGATENPHTITVLCSTNLTATFSKSEPPPTPGVTTNYWYIAFDGNGAASGAMAEQTNVCGVVTNLLPNAFVRTGYTFGGWTDKNGKTYADGATVTDLATTNRAVLLKAIWKPVEYLISFDPNGGKGTMESVANCRYGISYQLPACTFTCDKMSFAGWATNATGSVVYADGAIVRDLSVTGGVVTLYAVWGGQSQAFVNITGHTATKYYTGRPLTVSGYDVEIPSEGYYEKDFATVPGTVTTITETEVKYDGFGNVVKYSMGLTADSFTNLASSVRVLFEVTDGWLKILPSQIGGEPGDRTVPAGGLSKFDATVEYGTTFDCTAISNDFANAYGPCGIAYGALESGAWSADAPVFVAVGTTSFWYRVTATNLEPFVHEVAVTVLPCDVANVKVDTIPDQVWTGSPITPTVVVRAEAATLVEGVDYYLTYANNTDPGEATVTVHGMGNYTGTKAAHFRIVREIAEEPGSGTVPAGGCSKFDVAATYDGTAHTVDVAILTNAYAAAGYVGADVMFGATEEGPWENLPIALADAGATSFWYRVTADCCKPYVHAVRVVVSPQAGVAVQITGHVANCIYDGIDQSASGYDWKASDDLYTSGDFRCTAEAVATRRDVGTTRAGLTAASFENTNGNFTGVRFVVAQDVAVTILPAERTAEPGSGEVPEGGISKFDATAIYDGQRHTIDIIALTNAFADEGSTVTNLMYAPCAVGPWTADPIAIVNVGTTSFWYRADAVNYKPFAHEAKVTVTPRDLANVTVAKIPDQTCTGKAITPSVAVADGSPSIVTANDYDVVYSNNIEIGTATVTLTGKNNYTGTTDVTFTIVEKVLPRTLVKIMGHAVSEAYDGAAHSASGYDFVSTNTAYTAADFECKSAARVERTELGTSFANLTAESFTNLNSEFVAEFVVVRDISVTVKVGTISAEPGDRTVPAGGLSKFDATVPYDGKSHTFDIAALTNAFADAKYVVTNLEYAATDGGPWGSEPPAIADAGSTSFWYRVSCENYEPFVHQAKVTVTPCDTVVVRISGNVVTNVYDGLPHAAEGYAVSIEGSSLYSEGDFTFTGTARAERTKPGVSQFGLKSTDFHNANDNFSGVTFVIVRDGASVVVWDEPPFGVGEVGRYYGYALVELGFTNLANAVSMKVDGLPAGLSLKKANVNGYWYVEGIPTATASTNDGQCAYLRITRKVGTSKVEEIAELPIEVREARVREIDPSAVLGGTYEPTPIDELWPEVAEAVQLPKSWSFSGWPTGIKYTTRDVRGQADAYEVYGKATKTGVFTVTATRTVKSLFTTASYKEKYYASFMTEPIAGEGIAYTSQAYVAIASVTWTGVTSVSGLPTGLKYGKVKIEGEGEVMAVYGTPTKAGVFAVTVTKVDPLNAKKTVKETLLWQILPGENGGATVDFGGSKTEAGIVQVELGLPITWTLTADAGAKVTVSGLPTGLSYKNGTISGVPTRAGNYTVTVKTVANGVTVTQRFAVKATALPAMMVGTYYGAATNKLGTAEQFTLTLAATGKVSGNFYMQGKRIAFSAASLSCHDEEGRYMATIAYTYDRTKYTDELVLETTNAVAGVDLWQVSLGKAAGVLVDVDAQRDAVKAVGGAPAGNKYVVLEETESGEYLTARVTAAGVVTVSGKLADANGRLVAVSCSTRLMVLGEDRFGCWVTIYKTVSKQPPIIYVQFWEMD